MKINKYIYSLVGAALMLFGFAACSPDSFDMGDKDVSSADLTEGTAYSITHDSSNPNIVYLKSLMDSKYQVSWIEPQGRSQEAEVELHIPFPGTYDVQFGVETRGGVVYGETAHFTVDNFYAGFVDNELYTYLSGGVGQSKTWIPDDGNYGLASGELSYGDPSNPLGWNTFTPNWEPGYGGGGEASSADSPFKNSYWTFDLKDGAHVQVHQVSNSGAVAESSGTYLLDLDNYRLNLTDAQILHEPSWDNRGDANDWSKDIRIVTLNENQLRLGMLRNAETSGEGNWWLVFNFVSKDYADNYEAPEVLYEPKLEDGWRDFVEPKTDKVVTYQFTGFDWYGKDENTTAKNVTGVTPIDNISDMQIVMNSGDNTYEFTAPDGTTTTGSYTLSSSGVYTFTPALPTIALSGDGRAVLTNNEGQLRILGFSQANNCDGRTGGLDNIVWGAREYDDQGNFYQYIGYKLSVVRAGVTKTYKATLNSNSADWSNAQSADVYVTDGVDGEYTVTINGSDNNFYLLYLDFDKKLLADHPNVDITITGIKVDGNSISFDDAAIDKGTADGDGVTPRRYIVNPWGATAGEASKYNFNSSLSVTFSVKMDSGTPYIVSAKRHRIK